MSQPQTTISTNTETDMGGGADTVTSMVFQITGTWTGNLVPEVRVVGLAQANSQPVIYTNYLTGATVAAGTAITANGIYAVKCGGVTVSFVSTSMTGAAVVTRMDVLGVVQ